MERKKSDHESIVGPAAELHLALLVVERKPSDVDFASTLKDPRWDVITASIVPYHHIGLESIVETFMRAVRYKKRMSREKNSTIRMELVSHQGNMVTAA